MVFNEVFGIRVVLILNLLSSFTGFNLSKLSVPQRQAEHTLDNDEEWCGSCTLVIALNLNFCSNFSELMVKLIEITKTGIFVLTALAASLSHTIFLAEAWLELRNRWITHVSSHILEAAPTTSTRNLQ